MIDKIRNLCAKRGISIRRLEQDLGLGNGTIGRWERASPSVASAAEVARYFGVTLDYLAGIETDGNGKAGNREERTLMKLYRGSSDNAKEMILAVTGTIASNAKLLDGGARPERSEKEANQ